MVLMLANLKSLKYLDNKCFFFVTGVVFDSEVEGHIADQIFRGFVKSASYIEGSSILSVDSFPIKLRSVSRSKGHSLQH